MIPARLGSRRVERKNLRLINGKPLIGYIIEIALASKVFDEIYVNSEADIFKRIADDYGISFYKRPPEYSSNTATNDGFAMDFIENVPGEILIQLLPTSPLITVQEVKDFVKEIIDGNYDTLISIENKQIACLYNNKPINFSKYKINPPSQTMTPVQAYATVLMGWKYESFKKNIQKYGCAYHGGDGKTGYFELRGLSTIDIDREEDFVLVEAIIKSKYQQVTTENKYFGEATKEHAEDHVPSILKKDGVVENDFNHENKMIVNIPDILSSIDSTKSWSRRVINTENNSMTLISQLPGEGNRRHYHPDWNEWWYILDGKWEWEIKGKNYIVKKGDLVLIPKNHLHQITAVGDNPAIRMAISRADVQHVYPESD